MSTSRPQRVKAARNHDVIIIGGGHNGLVCATYLARTRRSVLVIEAAGEVGGGAITRSLAPGFQVSPCAHLLPTLPLALVQELGLESHGLAYAARQVPATALEPGGRALGIDPVDTAALETRARQDVAALTALRGRLGGHAKLLHQVLGTVPPSLAAASWRDRKALLGLGWTLRRQGRAAVRDLLKLGAMPIWDLLEDTFSDTLLKGALALDAVLGSNAGPRSPGTVFTLLHRMAASGTGALTLAQPAGGMGTFTQALARSAQQAGVSIRTGAEVARILVAEDRAAGVVLRSGEEIAARSVVSSADPRTTFMRLLGAEHLDTGFVRRITHLRSRGLTAKLHLALGQLPSFTGLPEGALSGRLLLAPSLMYIERAFNHSKYREASAAPILEITVPTVNDPSLAPPGKHVLSAIVQYVPYDLADPADAGRKALSGAVLSALTACAPGITDCIEAAELLLPQDLEREFRVSGGHWHHGELALDQFFWTRPAPGAAQYRSPLPGLYLCGAGCHPGGGLMGIAGRNAAREIARSSA
jgi:phytoene dehydrogenase-like protein